MKIRGNTVGTTIKPEAIKDKLGIPEGEGGGEGLSGTSKSLLVAILRNAVYTSNQSENITALEAELNKTTPHTHSYTSSVTTQATCTTDGVRTYICSCGHSYTEAIPATGHKYVDGVCSVCGATDPNHSGSEGDEPHTHSYSSSVTKEATCTTEGVRTYTCACGHAYTEPIAPTGHNFVNGTCTVCGEADPNYVVLTGITATYTGGDVEVGTELTELSGIVVTATYSDGSTETVTDYTLTGTIAEGSNTITVTYGGKTASFTVTGFELVAPDPVVNLSLTDVTDNVIINKGTGGATYNTTITDKSADNSCHISGESGLTLKKNASAVVNYGTNKNNPFTICVKAKLDEKSGSQFQMLFWTENDAPSVYYCTDDGGMINTKITGSTSGLNPISDKVVRENKCFNFSNENLDQSKEHTYVYIGDLDKGSVYLYIDGELMASQTMSTLPTANKIILGDNSGSYSASQITISDVRVWDCAVDINLI